MFPDSTAAKKGKKQASSGDGAARRRALPRGRAGDRAADCLRLPNARRPLVVAAGRDAEPASSVAHVAPLRAPLRRGPRRSRPRRGSVTGVGLADRRRAAPLGAPRPWRRPARRESVRKGCALRAALFARRFWRALAIPGPGVLEGERLSEADRPRGCLSRRRRRGWSAREQDEVVEPLPLSGHDLFPAGVVGPGCSLPRIPLESHEWWSGRGGIYAPCRSERERRRENSPQRARSRASRDENCEREARDAAHCG